MSSYKENFHLAGGDLIRQVTFGMNDGVVSLFALMAGLVGADQPVMTILLTLLAATIAGALSMAAGEFISGKGENEFFKHEIEQERLETLLCPDIEKEELRQIYRKKGFDGELLETIVNKISEDQDLWVKEMVIDELGTAEMDHETEYLPSVVIFFSFILGASFPVIPYILLCKAGFESNIIFYIATGVTVAGLFAAGALKKFVTGINWFKSGMEMLAVGAFTFLISYVVGMFLPV